MSILKISMRAPNSQPTGLLGPRRWVSGSPALFAGGRHWQPSEKARFEQLLFV